MKIESATNDTNEIVSEKVISFPLGIVGFEEHKSFQIYQQNEGDLVGYLQSVSSPELTLSILSPTDMKIFFEFSLNDEEEALLELSDAEDLSVFIIAYKNVDVQAPAVESFRNINANIMAPLLINSKNLIGMQKILLNSQRHITIKAD